MIVTTVVFVINADAGAHWGLDGGRGLSRAQLNLA